MNEDIMNPTEYWTPENIPDGIFTYNKDYEGEYAVDAEFVYERLIYLDRPNSVENFHAVVHFGITQGTGLKTRGEIFKFYLE